jgi:hypothetical protein
MPLTEDWPAPLAPTLQPAGGTFPGGMLALRGQSSGFARLLLETALGRKSVPLAIALALLGALGLFYISFLNGVAGLIVAKSMSVTPRPMS